MSEIRNRHLVLGAGGSARAVVYALLNDGWNVTIAARRIEQAQQLASSFQNTRIQIELDLSPTSQLSTFDLDRKHHPSRHDPKHRYNLPCLKILLLPSHTVIYDLVYNPRETKLVRDARAQGLQATTGLGMLNRTSRACL